MQTDSRTTQEILTDQFYEWELRGRGRLEWPTVVDLEPPFRPFLGHFLPNGFGAVDDGQVETGLSRLAERALQLLGRKPVRPGQVQEMEGEEPGPAEAEPNRPLTEFHLALPPDLTPLREIFEQCIVGLSYCEGPISFEVVATSESLVAQVACDLADAESVRSQLKNLLPGSGAH